MFDGDPLLHWQRAAIMAQSAYLRDRWTEDDVLALSDEEHSDVEWKAGKLYDEKSTGKFTSELSRQLSAFANSGGGHIIIGINDDKNTFDGLPSVRGNKRINAWIDQIASSLVAFPLQTLRVHPVERNKPHSLIDEERVVVVIDVADSPLAPHQATDKLYYKRHGANTVAAEHFYVEMLRNRYVGGVLDLTATECVRCVGYTNSQPVRIGNRDHELWEFALPLTVTNIGRVVCRLWTVEYSAAHQGSQLHTYKSHGNLRKPDFLQTPRPVLLPTEKYEFQVSFAIHLSTPAIEVKWFREMG